MQYAPTLGAPSGHWPPKWFPMAANEWRSPLSAGRVGAQKHTPPMFQTGNDSVWLKGALVCNCPCRGIGWGVCNTPLPLGTPLGHPPIKWFPTAANEWRSPLSAGRVGCKSIRPRCSEQETAACGRKTPIKCFPTAVPSGYSPLKCFPMAAPLGHWPPRCFPTAAPSAHWPLKCFPTTAPSGQRPL